MSDETADQLEEQLAESRAALALSIGSLKGRLSPSALMTASKAAVAEQVTPLVGQIDRAVRGKPLFAGLAGVALTGLVFGRERGTSKLADISAPAETLTNSLTGLYDVVEPVEEVEAREGEAKGPLIIAGILAAGAALAFAFPMTRTENRLMGEARVDLLRRGKKALRNEAIEASALASALVEAGKSDVIGLARVLRPKRKKS
jgi:hypothetical protein